MVHGLKFPEVFAELQRPGGLGAGTARGVFDAIFAGEWNAGEIAGFLVALRFAGETVEVVTAAAQAMRARMVVVEHDLPLVFDTCGTGGDGQGSLNISTGAALIVAAAGVPVAKHGNRAASSRSGSADVLGALGVSLEVPPAAQAGILARANIAFLFAPAHHPAMRFAGPSRSQLGIRTIFNVLGPLANPARATHQLIGAFSHEARRLMAATLRDLGAQKAWIVHSDDGLDEVSPYGPTRVSVVSGGTIEEHVISPSDFGLATSAPGAIAGGQPAENAAILQQVLAGAPHPARTALLLNAAAALVIARDLAPQRAAELARTTVDSGAALRTLGAWRQATLDVAPLMSNPAN